MSSGEGTRPPASPGERGGPHHDTELVRGGSAASLADALRRVNALLVGRPLGEEVLRAAAGEVAALADRLERGAGPGKLPRPDPTPGGEAHDFFPTSPVIGFANPVASPVEVWSAVGEEGAPEVRGRAFFDYPYEGPPTCVHGGVIAAVFDELLGVANLVAGRPSMTGTLHIVYRRTTPLRTPLELVARHTSVERRKVRAWGAILHEGELTAEAEGIFISVDPSRIGRIAGANAAGTSGEVIDAGMAALLGMGGAPDSERPPEH